MDYFNFYFIKKAIKYLFFNKKIRKILLIFIILFLLLIIKNKVFAVQSPTITYDNKQLTFSSTNNNFSNYSYYYIAIYIPQNTSTYSYRGEVILSNVELCFKPVSIGGTTKWYYCGVDNQSVAGSKRQTFSVAKNTTTMTLGTGSNINTNNYPQQQVYFVYPSTTPDPNRVDGAPTFFANYNFNFVNSSNQIVSNLVSVESPPSLLTSSTDIENWDFEFLEIDAGTTTTIENDVIQLTYNGRTVLFPANDYYYSNDNVFKIDINEINSKFVIVEDADFNIGYLDVVSLSPFDSTLYNFGTYNVVISSTKVAEINNNTDRDIQNNIYNQQTITNENLENINQTQQQTNEELSDLNDSITDDTVTSSAEDLPSTDVTDPSQNGIDNIFQSIYNAFCTGQAQDIVFPIPFTNKNITLNPYYISNMLNNNGASWVYTLIQAFWGYLIGRYIVKDISRKITKIKGGNIENLENENIKEEML